VRKTRSPALWTALLLLLLLLPPVTGQAARSTVLDAALSMLEDGNPFLVRYNERTGAGIEALCPLGCPYFWGGRRVDRLLEPAYPTQDSDYYKTDQLYLSGLDCAGLTRWILRQAGWSEHDSISRLLDRGQYRDFVVPGAAKTLGEERTKCLQVGDLVALQHASGGFHIALYIGTLMNFGYTAKTLPEELAPYLYYPLVIHCTGSGDYHDRYRDYLEQTGRTDILPPFGGVIVSLLDVPLSTAPLRTAAFPGLEEAPCFDLEGYRLTVLDLSGERQERWIRWRQKK